TPSRPSTRRSGAEPSRMSWCASPPARRSGRRARVKWRSDRVACSRLHGEGCGNLSQACSDTPRRAVSQNFLEESSTGQVPVDNSTRRRAEPYGTQGTYYPLSCEQIGGEPVETWGYSASNDTDVILRRCDPLRLSTPTGRLRSPGTAKGLGSRGQPILKATGFVL
ncbi:MAG: hypothetical protein K0R99_3774, partial [Microbacterium sp.]|nr:hypothetical protein [Microbacterium sp.]